MSILATPDSEYVIRQALRAQPDLTALVGRRVDLHEPRSPLAERIVLELVDEGEATDDPFNAIDCLLQAGCWAGSKGRAKQIADLYAGWVRTLRGTRVPLATDTTVPGHRADATPAFALFAVWQSTVPHPQSRRDSAGYIVTARFRLSPA